MVIRVALFLFCLLFTAVAPIVQYGHIDSALAYSDSCPPPTCAPPPCPPPSCGPPPCGSGLTGPGTLCGACISICTACCGTLIGIPAAIMQGILAPRYPQPSGCGPAMCPPPACAPPICAPPPITKCKPAGYGARVMPYGYAPAAAGSSPFVVPNTPPPTTSFYMGPPVEQSGLSNIVNQMVQMPFRLFSGTLTAPGVPWGQDLFATPAHSSTEALSAARYW